MAWVFCGLALRIAMSLGLHRKTPAEIDLSPSQLRLRSRLWWIAFSFDASVFYSVLSTSAIVGDEVIGVLTRIDRTLSLSQGRPPGVTDASYDRETILAEAGIGGDTSFPTFSQVYTWTCQLNQIQNRFCNIMHSRDTALSRHEAIVKVDDDLMAWKDGLPTSCRPGNLILTSSDRYIHVLLMHLEYFNLQRAIHWAAITLRPAYIATGPTELLTSRIRASERLCVESARSFINELNE